MKKSSIILRKLILSVTYTAACTSLQRLGKGCLYPRNSSCTTDMVLIHLPSGHIIMGAHALCVNVPN